MLERDSPGRNYHSWDFEWGSEFGTIHLIFTGMVSVCPIAKKNGRAGLFQVKGLLKFLMQFLPL